MEFNDEDVLRTLREVVAGSPDYVYTRPEHMLPLEDETGHVSATCFYVHTDPADDTDLSCGCLVGAVLSRLGVPLEGLAEQEGCSGYDVACEFGVSDAMASALNAAQGAQDSGRTWGASLARAEEWLTEEDEPC